MRRRKADRGEAQDRPDDTGLAPTAPSVADALAAPSEDVVQALDGAAPAPTGEPPPSAVDADADLDEELSEGTAAEPGDSGAAQVEPVREPEKTPDGPFYLSYSATTSVGKIRKNNQDSGYASPGLLVVADGMGGAAAGDLASAVAVDVISRLGRDATGREMLHELGDALRTANDRLADIVADDPAKEGMGTTVSSALFDGTQLGFAHIGDSRAYLLRDGEFEQLTHDHSWVQSLIDDGKLSEEEAAYHPHRSLLLRVLNGQPNNEPDLATLNVRAGDRLLFCSDGLCGFVPDPVLADLLAEPDRDRAVELLLGEALDAGGLDNITIIVADVGDTPPAEPPLPLMLGAATEVAIPELGEHTHAIELGDTAPPDPNAKPSAPRPVGTDDEDRYAPVPPPRRRWPKRLAVLLVILLVIAGAVVVTVGWGRAQYFVGAADGQVAIYQGVPDIVPGLHTSRVYEVHQIKISDLPSYYRDLVVNTMRADSLEAARQTVAELDAIAQRCVRARQGPGSPPPSTGSPPPSGASATPTTSTSPASSSAPPTPDPSSSASPGPTGSCE